MTQATEVIVVGAGPTGLTLALQAHDHGARVRIVEQRSQAFRPSRALILHPRTLEVLRPLGVTDALLAQAARSAEFHLHLGSRVIRVRLPEFALPDTAFPHFSLVRQMDVEDVLIQALEERGVAVEWGTELVEVVDEAMRARITLRSLAGSEQTHCDVLAGCDGPESTVRRAAGIGWHGGPYREEVVLADVELATDVAAGVSHIVVGRHGLLFVFALGERATWRLLATRPSGADVLPFGQPGPPVLDGELQALLDDAGLDARVTYSAWSARYRLQHRLASRFRQGRLFLAGDAAHATSPAGGQGMNAGIQDAANLGWKLAFAAASSDRASLLDSYDLERRPVARQLLALTRLLFWAEASIGPLPRLVRGVLAPLSAPAVPFLLERRRLVAEAIRLLSQLRVSYPTSPLSEEGDLRSRGGPHTGQRLPDATVTVDGRQIRLHALLAQPGIHVLLGRDATSVEQQRFGPLVTVHRLTSMPGTGLVAIRPDGYIGFRSRSVDHAQLDAWLARIGAGTPAAAPIPQSPADG